MDNGGVNYASGQYLLSESHCTYKIFLIMSPGPIPCPINLSTYTVLRLQNILYILPLELYHLLDSRPRFSICLRLVPSVSSTEHFLIRSSRSLSPRSHAPSFSSWYVMISRTNEADKLSGYMIQTLYLQYEM